MRGISFSWDPGNFLRRTLLHGVRLGYVGQYTVGEDCGLMDEVCVCVCVCV
jgi:hypothetical protein